MIKPPIPQFQKIALTLPQPTQATENTQISTYLPNTAGTEVLSTTSSRPTTTVRSRQGLNPVILAMLKKIRENKHKFQTTSQEWTTRDYSTTTASLPSSVTDYASETDTKATKESTTPTVTFSSQPYTGKYALCVFIVLNINSKQIPYAQKVFTSTNFCHFR